jgi:hypothetical protein
MDAKFITQLNGRDFVQYGGLLDEAHKQGLKRITTQLIQVPAEANKHMAIAFAEVVLERDGKERHFTGIGDASPANVNRTIAHHLCRMAETRAKARALRDAINVGVCAVEELGPDGELPEGYGHSGASASAVPTPAPITPAQLEQSEREMKRVGWTTDLGRAYLRKHFKKEGRSQLTTDEARQLIDHLKTLPDAAAPAARA